MLSRRISDAVELASRGEWQPLHRLIDEVEENERERAAAPSTLRHEIGNLLSIVQANVEGIMDGVLDSSPERLRNIREALVTAGEILNRFTW